MKPKIKQIGGPSDLQWEIEFDDGSFGYVRYRHGALSWGKGKTLDEAVEDSMSHLCMGKHGDGTGAISEEEMEQALEDFLQGREEFHVHQL